jgi:hypothetical protein
MNSPVGLKRLKTRYLDALKIAHVLLMLFFLEYGAYVFIRFGWPYTIRIFSFLGAFSIPVTLNSLVIFPVFGLMLYRKFQLKALPMFVVTGLLFEISMELTGAFFEGPAGQFPIPDVMEVWCLVVLICLFVVRPKINVNNWASVALFYWWVQSPFFYFAFKSSGDIYQAIQEVIFCAWVWLSFKPR